jgi:hypothetical protein
MIEDEISKRWLICFFTAVDTETVVHLGTVELEILPAQHPILPKLVIRDSGNNHNNTAPEIPICDFHDSIHEDIQTLNFVISDLRTSS